MKLNALSLRNYRRFKSVDLELPDGMTSITGSNGAGKSSLMEAVAWVLYGNQTEVVRTGKESIKREGSAHAEPCSVQLQFEFGGTGYVIERSMSGKNLTMSASLRAADKMLASSSDEVTEKIKEIFGMDHKSFFVSVFARQKELNALSSYTPAERKKQVLRMLDIDDIDEAIRRVREDKKRMDAAVGDARKSLEPVDGESPIERLKEELAGFAGKEKELLSNEKDKKSELDKAESVQKKLRAEMEKLDRDRKNHEQLLRKKDALEAKLAGIEENIESLSSDLKGLEKLGKELKALEQKASKANAGLEEIRSKKKKAKDELYEITSGMGKSAAMNDQLDNELSDIDEALANIEKLGAESECPTCLRKLGDTYEKLLDNYKKQKIKLEGEIKKCREHMEKLKAGRQECEARLEALRKREELLQGSVLAWEKSKSRLEKTDVLTKRIEAEEDRLADEKKQLAELVGQLKILKFDEVKYEKMTGQREELAEQIRALERILSGIREGRARLEEKGKSAEKELARLHKLESQIAVSLGDITLLSNLDSILEEFKKHMISRIRPALASVSSELLSSLTDARYSEIQLSDDYDISIRDAGSYHGIERFSGGESDLANLCLRLAISEVIAERHGTSGFDMIVLDEIFGSQDSNRKRLLLSTLAALGNRFKQIFLITHVEDVKELMGNVIQVAENPDGTSSAVLATGSYLYTGQSSATPPSAEVL